MFLDTELINQKGEVELFNNVGNFDNVEGTSNFDSFRKRNLQRVY
jgi:hypothetical protein